MTISGSTGDFRLVKHDDGYHAWCGNVPSGLASFGEILLWFMLEAAREEIKQFKKENAKLAELVHGADPVNEEIMQHPAVVEFLETWGEHCGAPRKVFAGHVRAMLHKLMAETKPAPSDGRQSEEGARGPSFHE